MSYRPVPSHNCSTASREYFCCMDHWKDDENHLVTMRRIDGQYTGSGGTYLDYRVKPDVVNSYYSASFFGQNAFYPVTNSLNKFVTSSLATHRKTGWKSSLAAKTFHGKVPYGKREYSASIIETSPSSGVDCCSYIEQRGSTINLTKYLTISASIRYTAASGFGGVPEWTDRENPVSLSYDRTISILATVNTCSGVIEIESLSVDEDEGTEGGWSGSCCYGCNSGPSCVAEDFPQLSKTASANLIASHLHTYEYGWDFIKENTPGGHTAPGGGVTATFTDTSIECKHLTTSTGVGVWYEISITLSNPWTEADCLNHAELLSAMYPLDDDIILPWRNDEYFSVEPYISYNESERSISPTDIPAESMYASGWTDPNALIYDGSVLGIPLPSSMSLTSPDGTSSIHKVKFDSYFSGRHANEQVACKDIPDCNTFWIIPNGTSSICPSFLGHATQWTPEFLSHYIEGEYVGPSMGKNGFDVQLYSSIWHSPLNFKGAFKCQQPYGGYAGVIGTGPLQYGSYAYGNIWAERMIIRRYAEILLFSKPSFEWCRPDGLYDLSQSYKRSTQDCSSGGDFKDIDYQLSSSYYIVIPGDTTGSGTGYVLPHGNLRWSPHPSGACEINQNGYWNDNKRKFEYCTQQYAYDWDGYHESVRMSAMSQSCTTCVGGPVIPPVTIPRPGTAAMISSIMTQQSFNYHICSPAVVAFQNSSSTWTAHNVHIYTIPDFEFNWVYGGIAVVDIHQWMPEPLWFDPPQKCADKASVSPSIYWIEDNWYIDTEINPLGKMCIDDGSSTTPTVADYTYYPMRPFVECMTGPPADPCNQITASTVANTRKVGCVGVLNWMNTNASSSCAGHYEDCNPQCLSPVVNGSSRPAQVFPWIIDIKELDCINGAERWDSVYAGNLAYVPTIFL